MAFPKDLTGRTSCFAQFSPSAISLLCRRKKIKFLFYYNTLILWDLSLFESSLIFAISSKTIVGMHYNNLFHCRKKSLYDCYHSNRSQSPTYAVDVSEKSFLFQCNFLQQPSYLQRHSIFFESLTFQRISLLFLATHVWQRPFKILSTWNKEETLTTKIWIRLSRDFYIVFKMSLAM